jgi:hypothetical protein
MELDTGPITENILCTFFLCAYTVDDNRQHRHLQRLAATSKVNTAVKMVKVHSTFCEETLTGKKVPLHQTILSVTLPQDQMLFHFLTQRLQLLLLEPDNTPWTADPQNILPTRIEELELAALLLDILLATLRDSNCISDKIQVHAGLLC